MQRPLYSLVGDEAEERRLLELDRQPATKGSIKDGIARGIDEIRKDDGVLVSEFRSTVKREVDGDQNGCRRGGEKYCIPAFGPIDRGRCVLDFFGGWSFDRSDKAIALAGHGFDVMRGVRSVAEGLPDFIFRGIKAMVEVDVCIACPDGLAQILAANQEGCFLHEGQQNLKWLLLNPDSDAKFAQFSGFGVEVKRAEAVAFHLHHIMHHDSLDDSGEQGQLNQELRW